jgi:hypothetical protein
MRLEKASHATYLSECETPRQAYLSCGVLKKTSKKEEAQRTDSPKSGLPDVSVYLTNTPPEGMLEAVPPLIPTTEADQQSTLEEEKVNWLHVGGNESEFVYDLAVLEGEIQHPVTDDDADDLYKWVKPLGKWISRYEAARAESQSSTPMAESTTVTNGERPAEESERMAAQSVAP